MPSCIQPHRSMHIFIKTPADKTINIEVDSTATVEQVKEKIWDKEGIPVDMQELSFNGIDLVNGNTLDGY